ncbi:hypothetical protein PUN28_007315 [Cardiocondyla obscurior]|uniref:Uncharacterized protein n=1 Tax=Cardiocondyla obscurior TaxID=286306 RepID=A0AAW2G3A0_9HYME
MKDDYISDSLANLSFKRKEEIVMPQRLDLSSSLLFWRQTEEENGEKKLQTCQLAYEERYAKSRPRECATPFSYRSRV